MISKIGDKYLLECRYVDAAHRGRPALVLPWLPTVLEYRKDFLAYLCVLYNLSKAKSTNNCYISSNAKKKNCFKMAIQSTYSILRENRIANSLCIISSLISGILLYWYLGTLKKYKPTELRTSTFFGSKSR